MWKAKFTAKPRQAANWSACPNLARRPPERLNFKIQFAGTTRYTSLASILEINSGEKT
jgi:hypothetical protein